MADLVEAVLKRDLPTLKTLLESERNIDETDQYGDTALMAAVATDQEETVAFLLEKKANPNHQNGVGSTPLHKAAVKNYFHICRVLIKHGANPQIKNNSGHLPSEIAPSMRLKEFLLGDQCVEILVPVPKYKHSTIIGKKGKMLQEIKEKSGAILIAVPPADSQDMSIVVKGTQENVNKARELILQTARKSHATGFMANNEMKETSESDDVTTVSFNVPADKHKYIIGKGGQVLRDLQEEFEVEIKLPTPSSGEDSVRVWGKSANVDNAIKKIFSLTKPPTGRGRGGRGGISERGGRGGNFGERGRGRGEGNFGERRGRGEGNFGERRGRGRGDGNFEYGRGRGDGESGERGRGRGGRGGRGRGGPRENGDQSGEPNQTSRYERFAQTESNDGSTEATHSTSTTTTTTTTTTPTTTTTTTSTPPATPTPALPGGTIGGSQLSKSAKRNLKRAQARKKQGGSEETQEGEEN